MATKKISKDTDKNEEKTEEAPTKENGPYKVIITRNDVLEGVINASTLANAKKLVKNNERDGCEISIKDNDGKVVG